MGNPAGAASRRSVVDRRDLEVLVAAVRLRPVLGDSVNIRLDRDILIMRWTDDPPDLAAEEGSLFSYLARVMKFARMLGEATGLDEFKNLDSAVRQKLAVIDARVNVELS